MINQLTGERRLTTALLVLRVALSALLAAHGWARLLSGGVEPFGGWLDSQGLPFGIGIAAGVTALEILGTPLLAWGRWVTWLCLAYIAVYATGMVMVHLPAGWFVVGLGRNGMEYSALLIVCLGLLAWVHAPRRATPA
jgi:putative oxidoreductase